MSIKSGIKRTLFNFAPGVADLLFRRPYIDLESKKRMSSEDEILHLDLAITECCSLNCRDCSNLMQYYARPEHISSEDAIRDLKKLLDCVRVEELKILGGEPFVNQRVLSDLLHFLSGEYGNRVRIINIITNGTVLPSNDCISAMKSNNKTVVSFSNYGELSSHLREFADICDSHGIRYSISEDTYYWIDFGSPVDYNESDKFLRKQYKYCYNRKNCTTLYRGCIYTCPRQAHGIHLGLFSNIQNEYVNLYDPQYANPDELREAVIGVIRRDKPINACKYCIYGKYIHVPRSVQKERIKPAGHDEGDLHL